MTNETFDHNYVSDLLDEVYRLRRALADEAAITAAHLTLKSFPKSRRGIAEDQIDRMRQAARGEVQRAYAGRPSWAGRHAMTLAGASETLTRGEWEAERAR